VNSIFLDISVNTNENCDIPDLFVFSTSILFIAFLKDDRTIVELGHVLCIRTQDILHVFMIHFD
jgi:hypothetical protein